jgi:hypothetical protein
MTARPLLALGPLALAACSGDNSGSDNNADAADLAYRHPMQVIAQDLDGDGLADVAIARHDFQGNASLAVLINTSSGGPLATFAAAHQFGVPLWPMAMASGDLDGDGHPDLVTAHAVTNQLSFEFQDAAHPGSFPTSALVALPQQPAESAIGDLDHDGAPDVAVAMNDASAPVITLHDPVLANAYLPPAPLAGALGNSVSIGDVDGDGFDDVVMGSIVDPQFGVVLFRQDPAHAGSFLAPVLTATATDVERLLLADLDDDGFLDVAVGGRFGTIDVLYQDSANPGHFLAPVTIRVAPDETFQESLAAADLDGDGNTDLVVVTNDTHVFNPDPQPPVLSLNTTLSVLLQDPVNPRVFRPATNYALDQDTSSVAIADLNGDTRPDLIAVGHNPQIDSFLILFQDPPNAGVFGAPVNYPVQ